MAAMCPDCCLPSRLPAPRISRSAAAIRNPEQISGDHERQDPALAVRRQPHDPHDTGIDHIDELGIVAARKDRHTGFWKFDQLRDAAQSVLFLGREQIADLRRLVSGAINKTCTDLRGRRPATVGPDGLWIIQYLLQPLRVHRDFSPALPPEQIRSL